MRSICIVLITILPVTVSLTVHAQLLKKIKEKVVQKVDARANSKEDKAIDKTLDDVEKTAQGKKASGNESNEDSKTASVGIKSYSRFDFVPGDKIIYAEDFSQDVVGEFPLKWNTNGSGEIVTVEGQEGKWLQMKERTNYVSPMNIKVPDNYTVEFDLLVDFKSDQRVPPINIYVTKSTAAPSDGESYTIYNGIVLKLAPNGGMAGAPDNAELQTFDSKGQKYYSSEEGTHMSVFTDNNKKNIPIHVAIWAQKERLRVWLNQNKLYDLPKALAPGTYPTNVTFKIGTYGGPQNNYQYLVSNLKVAVAAPDTRSKLITEGKWSTSGILFDVNSDKIKPVSAGVLKEIAGVLNDNPTVRVKIIGHTDSDGDATKNLELSKRRALAVKNALASEYKIDASRMDTDGMGASKPVADNKTAEGKAQNRRVEFVKL